MHFGILRPLLTQVLLLLSVSSLLLWRSANGTAALYSIGVPGFNFEYSDEPVLLFDEFSSQKLPLYSTAHLSMATPVLQNVSAPFIVARVKHCRASPERVNGSIVLIKYSDWSGCYSIGIHNLNMIRQFHALNASGIVLEIKMTLPVWVPQATVYYLDGVNVPVLWVYTGHINATYVLDNATALGMVATIIPPSPALPSQIAKLASLSFAYQRVLMALWILLFLVTLFTLILRLRVEKKIKQLYGDAQTSLLRLALFFILIMCIVRIAEKVDPASTHGLLARSWAMSGNFLFMESCCISIAICVAVWWAMIVSLQKKSELEPYHFRRVAAIALVLLWVASIAAFVVDSFVAILTIWASIFVIFFIISVVTSLVYGIIFLVRLKRSHHSKRRRGKAYQSLKGTDLICCGRFELSHVDFILLRMGSFVTVLFISISFFAPLFAMMATPVLPFLLGFFVFDILAIFACIFVNLMVFVAPKKRTHPHRHSRRSPSPQHYPAVARKSNARPVKTVAFAPAESAEAGAVDEIQTPRSEIVTTMVIVTDD